jgi:hypothetical protein
MGEASRHETKVRQTRVWELTRHFFRRFFENDVVESGGDVVTTVVRALSIVAAPGLMFAFWLQNQYVRRSQWGRVEDEYFFVMFSFVAMAGVAVFEWEMLFPDRLDFLVLTPLSLRRWEMPAAKALALGGFLGIFLIAANVFGMFMLPAVAQVQVLRQMEAHAVAALLAGAFGALAVMAMGGVLLCVLPERVFRRVSPVARMLTVTALALVVVHYARFGDAIEGLLADGGQRMRWMPTFWFLGLYQWMQHGAAAPAFAWAMARRAEIAMLTVMAVVLVVYPMAWARMRRMAIEAEVSRGAKRGAWTQSVVHAVVRRPEERAVFHFIGQTMARNSRYQVYMAMYFGTGLALAISCATRVEVQRGVAVPGVSQFGLHAVMPLLVFWTVAGLKMAFGFPMNLPAGWVFRATGAQLERCVRASRTWALACSLSVVAAVMAALVWAGWSARQIVVQMICGVCLSVLLVEGFFFAQTSVPFNRPRRPGRTSLPLMLTLHLGVLAPFVVGMIWVEQAMERRALLLAIPIVVTAAAHWLLRALRERSVLMEEEREGAGGEFQLLGLAGELTS